MITLNDIEILKECFLFENLSSSDFSDVNEMLKKENCTVVQYQKDEFIVDKEHSYKLGIILSGKATAVCSQKDKSELKSFFKGDVFGAAGVFCKNIDTAFSKIKATSSCRILFLDRDFIEKLIVKNPDIAIKYIEFLSDRVEFLNGRIATFTSNQAVKKLAKYILENQEYIKDKDVNFAALARSLDISRASLYRAKNVLEETGAAQFDLKRINLLSQEILKSHLN